MELIFRPILLSLEKGSPELSIANMFIAKISRFSEDLRSWGRETPEVASKRYPAYT